jgi:hypothetical protein
MQLSIHLMKTTTRCLTMLAVLALPAAAHPDQDVPAGPQGAAPAAGAPVRTGNGSHTFQAHAWWGKLPEGKALGPTHGGVAVDSAGLIYASTEAAHSICVFRPDGSLVKSISPDKTGFHSLMIRKEGDQEFLYGAFGRGEQGIKMDLDGKTVQTFPKEGVTVPGGLQGVTAVTVAPDGAVFVAVGYGSNKIHKFSPTGELLKSFGGPGEGPDGFKACHGLIIDTRFGAPRLLVADRENRRLVHLDLDGNFLGVHATGLRRPCAMSFHAELLAVAELEGRVTLLDKQGTPVAFLGDNPDKGQWANFGVEAAAMKPGEFTAPHGLCFDAHGNLYVEEWNKTGRLTRLEAVKP